MPPNSVPVPRSSLESPPVSLDVLLEDCEQWSVRVRGLSEDTARRQRVYQERFVELSAVRSSACLVQWLCVRNLQQFMVEYACTYGPGSQKWLTDSLRNLVRFCWCREYIAEDLSCAVPRRCRRRLARVPRSLDDERIARLLASLDCGRPAGCRDAAIITLAATYGVRGVQLRSMRLDDIDWEAEQIHFPAGKGGKALCLPLTAEAGNAVLQYLLHGRPNEPTFDELFLKTRPPFGPFYNPRALPRIVSRRLERAGIDVPEGVSRGLSSFRHAFASRLVGQVPFKHITDLLGHRDPNTSFIYTKVDFQGLEETALPWPGEVSR